MVGFKKKFRETPVFYFQNDQFCRQVLTLGKRSYPERIDHDTEMGATRLEKLIFRMSLNVSLKRHPSLYFNSQRVARRERLATRWGVGQGAG